MFGFNLNLRRYALAAALADFADAEAGATARVAGRGLHSLTLELNLSNSRTHLGLSWIIQWAEELKLS
jgi:hypothetical protein